MKVPLHLDGETGRCLFGSSNPSTHSRLNHTGTNRVKLKGAPSVTRLGEPLTAPLERAIHGVLRILLLVVWNGTVLYKSSVVS